MKWYNLGILFPVAIHSLPQRGGRPMGRNGMANSMETMLPDRSDGRLSRNLVDNGEQMDPMYLYSSEEDLSHITLVSELFSAINQLTHNSQHFFTPEQFRFFVENANERILDFAWDRENAENYSDTSNFNQQSGLNQLFDIFKQVLPMVNNLQFRQEFVEFFLNFINHAVASDMLETTTTEMMTTTTTMMPEMPETTTEVANFPTIMDTFNQISNILSIDNTERIGNEISNFFEPKNIQAFFVTSPLFEGFRPVITQITEIMSNLPVVQNVPAEILMDPHENVGMMMPVIDMEQEGMIFHETTTEEPEMNNMRRPIANPFDPLGILPALQNLGQNMQMGNGM